MTRYELINYYKNSLLEYESRCCPNWSFYMFWEYFRYKKDMKDYLNVVERKKQYIKELERIND